MIQWQIIMLSAHKELHDDPFASGSLELFSNFLDKQQSDNLLKELITIDHWNDGQYSVAGRRFSMPRAQTWYADPGIVYNFSYDLHKHRGPPF